jgi:hypothetical protein
VVSEDHNLAMRLVLCDILDLRIQPADIRLGVVLFGGQKPYSLRHQQLHHQKFQDPTPSSVFAAFKAAQNNLEKLNYQAQSGINRTTQSQYFKILKILL